MRPRLVLLLLLAPLVSGAAAFLVSNSPVSGVFVYESVPPSLRPVDILVDTEPVAGVGDSAVTRALTQDLMNQWNAALTGGPVFGTATEGGPYNAATAGDTFGVFPDSQFEVAFDDTGGVFAEFGLGAGVLGITLKSVDVGSGSLLDFLVIINTSTVALSPAAQAEDLFRATLLHELGHGAGMGHTAVGMTNTNSFGLVPATPQQIPSMFPFRLPIKPIEGMTLEADDAAGINEIYVGDVPGTGSISGTVRAPSGTAVNEIAVRAVGPDGTVESHVGILSNTDGLDAGSFRIPNLAPGGYRVLIETVNGRGSVTGGTLGDGGSLGADPFLYAVDEFWQPGDTFDPADDNPADFALVQVRADRDTGSIDFVLNGEPLTPGQLLNASLAAGDALIPDVLGGFHYADYYVFEGTVGADVTIDIDAAGFVPQLRLLRPGDLAVETEALPAAGASLDLDHTLERSGVYVLLVFARATTGNAGGTGAYGITLTGAQAVPAPPAATPALAGQGAEDPGSQQVGSPACALPVLQVRLDAPSHEELWVDRVTVRATGTGNDASDLTEVRLAHDRNGDGVWSPSEPVLGTGTYGANNGTVEFDGLGLQLPAGTAADLLVLYEIDVTSVSSATAAGAAVWWLLPALLPLVLLRRRRWIVIVLLLAVCPLACGGGGGGGNCAAPFDPGGAIVTFQAIIDAGGIVAFTPTTNPATPLPLPAGAIISGLVSVSN